jgi:uncharacterized membrane protein
VADPAPRGSLLAGQGGNKWLSERRRSAAALLVAAGAAALLIGLKAGGAELAGADLCVVVLVAYLFPYLLLTASVFARASSEGVRTWAQRSSRGTLLQRYVFGTAPGPGVSIFIAAAALVVVMVWRPGHIDSSFGPVPRALLSLTTVVVAWICVVVSFAVAFQADNLVEGEEALEFPGRSTTIWLDYMYFALSVMTTLGTTDVMVTSHEMRRTVAANSVIAFVFNTITVASLVSALNNF